MSELQRWAENRPALIPSRTEREHKKAVEKLVAETKFSGLKIDAEAALTGRIMERVCDVDQYRRSLAQGDPVLDSVLTRVELGFADKAIRIQRQFGSEFPL